MFDKNMLEEEIKLLIKCGHALNGYSKSFRVSLAEKSQQERIAFMRDLLADAEQEARPGMKLVRQNEIQDVYQCSKCGGYETTPRDCDVPACSSCELDIMAHKIYEVEVLA